MATPSAVNAWLDELVLSLIPSSTTKPTTARKLKESFHRRVKHHPYGRTDQFAVREKLIGLEEKFLVLNQDDIAQKLFFDRTELEGSHGAMKWLPDAIDLLLHLSQDPIRHASIDKLKLKKREVVIPQLTWDDVFKDDPIDANDPLWIRPKYEDFSSEEDEGDLSPSVQTSPFDGENQQHYPIREDDLFEQDRWSRVDNGLMQLEISPSAETICTEVQATREVLFMLEGLPTPIFTFQNDKFRPKPRCHISQLDEHASRSLLTSAAELGNRVAVIRRWLHVPQKVEVLQLIHDQISSRLLQFAQQVNQEHSALIAEPAAHTVVSLLSTLERLRLVAHPLESVTSLLGSPVFENPVSALEALSGALDVATESCDEVGASFLLSILLSALQLFAQPIDLWLRTGTMGAEGLPFIENLQDQSSNFHNLWHDWFALSQEPHQTLPSLLSSHLATIFTIGKTAVFLRQLGIAPIPRQNGIVDAVIESGRMVEILAIPFSVSFDTVLARNLNKLLVTSTGTLQQNLNNRREMQSMLDAFDFIFFAMDGSIVDTFESKMFDRIDRCIDTWNDRFLLKDKLIQAFGHLECINSHAIVVQSTYTSPDTMQRRRGSVKMLSAMSISYQISWPLANIVRPTSMESYQRVALFLRQMRRAKHVLERRVSPDLHRNSNGELRPSGYRQATLLLRQLSVFVNTLYTHLTDCTIRPLTTSMRELLEAPTTRSLDDMIRVHASSIDGLEHACLSNKRLKPLRDSVITILDLCIALGHLLHSTNNQASVRLRTQNSTDDEAEVKSFVSAGSRRKRRESQHDLYTSSDEEAGDDDGKGGGYSTLVIDNTSISQEIMKMTITFKKNLDFLMAGLRALPRSSDTVPVPGGQKLFVDMGNRFQLLADTLGSAFRAREDGPGYC
jgi:gamma-tubulin complex component 5